MADSDQSPGLLSQAFSGLGGLLGLGGSTPAPQPAARQRMEDFIEQRQNARFTQMSNDVRQMLKDTPIGKDIDYGEAAKDLRKKGYNQAEEDAMLQTLAHAHGRREGEIAGRPSYREGETIPTMGPTGESYETVNPQIQELHDKFTLSRQRPSGDLIGDSLRAFMTGPGKGLKGIITSGRLLGGERI